MGDSFWLCLMPTVGLKASWVVSASSLPTSLLSSFGKHLPLPNVPYNSPAPLFLFSSVITLSDRTAIWNEICIKDIKKNKSMVLQYLWSFPQAGQQEQNQHLALHKSLVLQSSWERRFHGLGQENSQVQIILLILLITIFGTASQGRKHQVCIRCNYVYS